MARKPNQTANALLTPPAIHTDLKSLFDAVVMVSVWSGAIGRCYADMLDLKESRGLPTADEWPDSAGYQRNREQMARVVEAERAKARDGEFVMAAPEPRWTELMRQWTGYYRDWCAAIANAKELAKSAVVAAIMDAGEPRPAHRWTTQASIDLDNLAGTLHPINVGGVDGLGFIRAGLPPLPKDFQSRAEAVGQRIVELRAIPASANATRLQTNASKVQMGRTPATSTAMSDPAARPVWNPSIFHLRESYEAVIASTMFLPRGVKMPGRTPEWTNVEVGTPGVGEIRPGDCLIIGGGVRLADVDGAYNALALDRAYDAPLDRWTWMAPMQLPRIGLRTLDHVADLCRWVGLGVEWLREHSADPWSGWLPTGEHPRIARPAREAPMGNGASA